jgi:hypothetical protein
MGGCSSSDCAGICDAEESMLQTEFPLEREMKSTPECRNAITLMVMQCGEETEVEEYADFIDTNSTAFSGISVLSQSQSLSTLTDRRSRSIVGVMKCMEGVSPFSESDTPPILPLRPSSTFYSSSRHHPLHYQQEKQLLVRAQTVSSLTDDESTHITTLSTSPIESSADVVEGMDDCSDEDGSLFDFDDQTTVQSTCTVDSQRSLGSRSRLLGRTYNRYDREPRSGRKAPASKKRRAEKVESSAE